MQMSTLQVFEKQIEPNLLAPYAEAYPAAVERVATALRARFESGALRGWLDADDNFGNGPLRRRPPLWKLEKECSRRYITTPLRALAVLKFSPNAHDPEGPYRGSAWHWNRHEGTCLLSAAEAAMSRDVLHFARERGWSKPQRGEEPTFKRTRRAA